MPNCINCLLVPRFISRCCEWPRHCVQIFIYCMPSKPNYSIPAKDITKDLICILGAFSNGGSQQYFVKQMADISIGR